MKKPENRPVCPYGTTYAEFLQERPGRKLRTPEAQRKQINAALDNLQSAGDFWTLEVLRRLLQLLTVYDDVATLLTHIVSHIIQGDERQLNRILHLSSGIVLGFTPRKGGGSR